MQARQLGSVCVHVQYVSGWKMQSEALKRRTIITVRANVTEHEQENPAAFIPAGGKRPLLKINKFYTAANIHNIWINLTVAGSMVGVWRWHFVCFGYRCTLSAFSIHIKRCSSLEKGTLLLLIILHLFKYNGSACLSLCFCLTSKHWK